MRVADYNRRFEITSTPITTVPQSTTHPHRSKILENQSAEGPIFRLLRLLRVQTDISVLGNNECPPQERRALGYCITEVGHRLENTQGGVPNKR